MLVVATWASPTQIQFKIGDHTLPCHSRRILAESPNGAGYQQKFSTKRFGPWF
jgi:hypothetical protein